MKLPQEYTEEQVMEMVRLLYEDEPETDPHYPKMTWEDHLKYSGGYYLDKKKREALRILEHADRVRGFNKGE